MQARSQQDIADIFASAGLQMSGEELASAYEKVRSLCASAQRRGPYFGASIVEAPTGCPSRLLLFLDGDEHAAVRSAAASVLLDPATHLLMASQLSS